MTTPCLSDLRAVARALGGEASGGQVLAPGPGHSRFDRSMAVRPSATSPVGFIAHSFAGQSWPELREHICRRLGIDLGPVGSRGPKPTARPSRQTPPPKDEDGRTEAARVLWVAGVDPRGTPVESYLTARGLTLEVDLAGEVLRWHGGIAAMLAKYCGIGSGEPRAVSQLYLREDGSPVFQSDGKTKKRRFTGPVGGAAVMLDAFDAVSMGLHIGEGVETCMSARQLDLRPCWALGSAGPIAAFPVLGGVDCLTIVADHDVNGRGQRAAAECAERWRTAGREARILALSEPGDFNDLVK